MKRYLTTTGTTLLIVVASAIAWMLILTYAWPSSAKPDVPMVYPQPEVEQLTCYTSKGVAFSLLPIENLGCMDGSGVPIRITLAGLWEEGWRIVAVVYAGPDPARPQATFKHQHTVVVERDLP